MIAIRKNVFNLTFESCVEYGLRIFYTKPQDNNLYIKDLEGNFEETPNGCKIEYLRSIITNNITFTYKINYMYFFQRVIFNENSCFPPINEEGENDDERNVYFMKKIRFDYDHSTKVSQNGGIEMYNGIADIQDENKTKAPLSHKELNDIIKNKLGIKTDIINESIQIYQ